MIEIVVERIRDSRSLAPVYVAGPSRIYSPIIDAEALIDTNGSFGQNIKQSLDVVSNRHPGLPVAFMTCDVLPAAGALQRLLAEYRRHAPCDLWFPIVPAPEERLPGTSAWKPRYRIVPEPGLPAVAILPGHLVVVEPPALRLEFIYNLFQIAYATRNRPIAYRRNVMLRKLVLQLLYQDLRHVLGLRLPSLTWNVVSAGVTAAGGLRRGTILRRELEHLLRKLFVKTPHRRRYPRRRIALSFIDELSIALDIDTEEEAQSITAAAAT
jgi:hypothetical protein